MPRFSTTNLILDSELEREATTLFSDLGLDITGAVTLFLKQTIRVQGLPFLVTRDNSNAQTIVAMNEYYEMKAHLEKYKRYSSFEDAMNEVLEDDWNRPINCFKRDLKFAKKHGYNLNLLNDVVDTLARQEPLPEKNRDYSLTGNYIGFGECHILSDWLLVYRVDNEELLLFLSRTRTHSDLFD